MFMEAEDNRTPPMNWGRFFVYDFTPQHRLLVDLQTREAAVVNPTDVRRTFLRHPIHVCILYLPLLEGLSHDRHPLVTVNADIINCQPGLLTFTSAAKWVQRIGQNQGIHVDLEEAGNYAKLRNLSFYSARARNRELANQVDYPVPENHAKLGRVVHVVSNDQDENRYLVYRFKPEHWHYLSRVSGQSLLGSLVPVHRLGGSFTPDHLLLLDLERGRGFFFDPTIDYLPQYVQHSMRNGPLCLPFLRYLSGHHQHLSQIPRVVRLPGPISDVEMPKLPVNTEWTRRLPLQACRRNPEVPEEEDGQSVMHPEDWLD